MTLNETVSQARGFRILGIQQVAIGGLSKDKLRSLWVDMLGLQVKSLSLIHI
jgi:lactoylglutathione lyase